MTRTFLAPRARIFGWPMLQPIRGDLVRVTIDHRQPPQLYRVDVCGYDPSSGHGCLVTPREGWISRTILAVVETDWTLRLFAVMCAVAVAAEQARQSVEAREWTTFQRDMARWRAEADAEGVL